MQKINNMLHQSRALFLLAAVAMIGTIGCKTGGVPFLDPATLRDRQLSVAETPLANATSPKPPSAIPLAPNDPSLQLASYAEGNGSEGVAPAQYVNRTSSRADSVSVPRIPMGPVYQSISPEVPARGSPYHPASHAHAINGNQPAPHQHGPTCACGGHGGGRYVPVFPQKNGEHTLGCSICGSNACGGSCTGGCGPIEVTPVPRMVDPQEYIYDGGDRDPQVRLRSNNTQVGLDPEDTVIQYQTLDGKTNVDSGCRVAIYAPRFGSVRKRQGITERDMATRLQSANLPAGPVAIREKLPSGSVTQPIKSLNKENVRVVEAFRDRNQTMPSDRVLPMGTLSDAFKPFEDLSLIRKGDLKGTDPVKLAKATAAARSWTNVDELRVTIDGKEAIETKDLKRAADVTLYELKGARVRLCKIASEQIASPGDTISFTIRFDNVGETPVSNIVIADSLAPRLEYVDNSQQSSLKARFSTKPNEAGSVVLRWELENPLPASEGGLVRFSCIVR